MATDLELMVEQVNDEEGFLRFLAALAADWEEQRRIETAEPPAPYSAGALGWENGKVCAFLDAAVGWARASVNGLQYHEKPSNPWHRVAQILFAGKFYE